MTLHKVKDNPFYKWIEVRIKKNRNAIIILNGPTGSGKTYSAIGMALEVARRMKTNFTVRDNLDFTFRDLVMKMEKPENQKPGTCFVLEEVGAVGGGASSREWQSNDNKLFFSWLQTSRHQNQVFIMTCPTFDNLEAGARRLCHWQINTNGIDYINKVAFLRPYRVTVNSRTGKFYFKYLRFQHGDLAMKLSRLEVPHIPEEMVKQYEQKKDIFSKKLRHKIIGEPDVHRKKGSTINIAQINKLFERNLKQKEIAQLMGVAVRTVQKYKAEWRKHTPTYRK